MAGGAGRVSMLSRKVPSVLPGVVFGGTMVVIGLLGLVAVVVAGSGRTVPARVVAQGAEGTELEVAADGRTDRYLVDWRTADGVPVGSSIDVILEDGGIRPAPGLPAAFSVTILVIGLVVGALPLVMRRRRFRGMARPQRAAARAVRRGVRRPVLVEGRFTGDAVDTSRVWLDITDAASGQRLGSVAAALVLPTLHPAALRVLVGDPARGAVALETLDGAGRLLPVSPLVERPPASAPWSPVVERLLGWQEPVGQVAPALGAVAHVSAADLAPASELPVAIRDRAIAVRRQSMRLAIGLGIGVLAGGVVVTAVPSLGLLPVLLLLAAAAAFTAVRRRQIRAAGAAVGRDLGLSEPEATVAGCIVLGLAPDPAKPPIGLDLARRSTASPPAPPGWPGVPPPTAPPRP